MSCGSVCQSFWMKKATDILIFQSFQYKLGSSVIFRGCSVVKGRFAAVNPALCQRFTGGWIESC